MAWIPVTSVATVDVSYALGTEFKADSVSGGIDDSTVGDVVTAGARRIAVVRAIGDSADPERAAAALRRALA